MYVFVLKILAFNYVSITGYERMKFAAKPAIFPRPLLYADQLFERHVGRGGHVLGRILILNTKIHIYICFFITKSTLTFLGR